MCKHTRSNNQPKPSGTVHTHTHRPTVTKKKQESQKPKGENYATTSYEGQQGRKKQATPESRSRTGKPWHTGQGKQKGGDEFLNGMLDFPSPCLGLWVRVCVWQLFRRMPMLSW